MIESMVAGFAARLMLREFMEAGEDRIEVIRECFASNWETLDNKYWPDWMATPYWSFALNQRVLTVRVTYRSAVDRLGDVAREEG